MLRGYVFRPGTLVCRESESPAGSPPPLPATGAVSVTAGTILRSDRAGDEAGDGRGPASLETLAGYAQEDRWMVRAYG